MAEDKRPILVIVGVWAWGGATALLAVAAFVFLVAASIYIVPTDKFSSTAPAWMPGVYTVLKDHNQLVAAILAVSGLAWSYFFQWKT